MKLYVISASFIDGKRYFTRFDAPVKPIYPKNGKSPLPTLLSVRKKRAIKGVETIGGSGEGGRGWSKSVNT
jgi:hypothetical protein